MKPCLDSLRVFGNKMVFSSRDAAETFGRTYLKLQTEHWGGPEATIRYHLFARALKAGLADGTISRQDFYMDDRHVMERIRASRNPEITRILGALEGNLRYEFTEESPQLILRKKFRHVDPEFLSGGKLLRLSEQSQDFRDFLEEHRKLNEKGISVNLFL